MSDKIANWEVSYIDEDGNYIGNSANGSSTVSASSATNIEPNASLIFITPTIASVTFRINDGVDGQRLTIVHTNTNESIISTIGTYAIDTQLNAVGEWVDLIFSADESEWIQLGTNGVQA